MSNTQLHGRSYNSQKTVLTDGRANKIWDSRLFAHIIERKLLPFSPAHVRPPRLSLQAVMAKDKDNNNAYASSKMTTSSSQRRKYWWNRKKNYEIKKEIKKIMLPGCIFRTTLTN
ncbi:hypothetical protein Bca52824_050278 [Brassica carinata]|uniref:Uncharacterized protein n=1 Tax=Brassica carinata TaxID=52824 RepID=A0A8X7RKG5_BRACI|nr:hypothetical protein Bca52824_050278 [Brassica carinata]